MALGIYFVRAQRKRQGIPKPAKAYRFEAWHVAVIFTILVNIYMLVMPWYPPTGGANGGDVSFWYASEYCTFYLTHDTRPLTPIPAYAATGIGILIACGVYYVLWIYAIPRWRG